MMCKVLKLNRSKVYKVMHHKLSNQDGMPPKNVSIFKQKDFLIKPLML